MQKISLCITTFNRNAYLFKSFEQVIEDERIGEIVIVDDCSDKEIYRLVESRCKHPKIKLFRNHKNLGCYENKKVSVQKSENEYCIIFDSDNVIGVDYLDSIYSKAWNPKTIFAPDFAKPVFDYRRFAGTTFNKSNVRKFAFGKGFDCLMNTMNYFVHRDSYLSVWQAKKDIKGADSIYMNYLWLMAGNDIHVLKGLSYFHRLHDGKSLEHGSNYINFARESAPQCKQIEKQISLMR